MRIIITFFFVFFSCQIITAQYILLDSIPTLITDTQSINSSYIIPFYDFNMLPDSLPIFYEKKFSSTDTASIWCRNINSISPEKLFLQSGNGIIFRHPVADRVNILWCESNFQGQFDIYGFEYDNNFNITDTLRLTNDTIEETSIAIQQQSVYVMYWIQKNDSLLISQHFDIQLNTGHDSINIGTKDTIDNHCLTVYANTNTDFLYTKSENDSIHLFLDEDAIDTTGNIIGLYVSKNMTLDNFLWEKNDSILSYGIPYNYVLILVNYNTFYLPYKPSVFDQYLFSKFLGGTPLLAYTIKDSTNIFAFSYDAGSIFGSYGHGYYYFYNYDAPAGEAFSYFFPSNYDIQEIKIFPEISNGMLYIVIRVLVNNYERLYCFKSSPTVGFNTITQDNWISIFPNPATDNLTISIIPPEVGQANSGLQITGVSIYNIMGKEQAVTISGNQPNKQNIPAKAGISSHAVIARSGSNEAISSHEALNQQIASPLVRNDEIRVSISTLPAGLYFVKVVTNQGTVVKKFVKN